MSRWGCRVSAFPIGAGTAPTMPWRRNWTTRASPASRSDGRHRGGGGSLNAQVDTQCREGYRHGPRRRDRKSVVAGTSVSVRVDLDGSTIIIKKTHNNILVEHNRI